MVQPPRLETGVVVVPDADTDRGCDIARALSPLGAAVVLAGSDTQTLAALAAELGSGGGRVAVLVDDVATEAGRATLVEMVNELFARGNG